MRAHRRLMSFVLSTTIMTLSGCALDPTYNFDDTTIFKGHQAWETKRHADDWVVPLGDGMSVLGATFLVQAAQNSIDDVPDQTSEPNWHHERADDASENPERRPAGSGKKVERPTATYVPSAPTKNKVQLP